MRFFGFGKSTSKTKGQFVFVDGSRLSPEEYGYLAVGVGWRAASERTSALFFQGAAVDNLSLARAIQNAPYLSDFYLTSLNIGAYIHHASSLNDVDQAVMTRIDKGILDGLGDARTSNEEPLGSDLKDLIFRLAKLFAEAFSMDVLEANTRKAGAVYIDAMPSTEFLFNGLIKATNNDPAVMKSWREEIHTTGDGLLLTHVAQAFALNDLELLHDTFVRYEV